MREWTYERPFIKLITDNTLAYYRRNATLIYGDETVVSDYCMYLRDDKACKWVEIVYDLDINKFINVDIKEDDYLQNKEELFLVDYTTSVMNIMKNR